MVCRSGNIETRRGVVSRGDIERLIQDADTFAVETKYDVVSSTPIFFVLDDEKHYIDVVGNKSVRMRGKISFVLARKSFIVNITKVMKKLGVEVKASYTGNAGGKLVYSARHRKGTTVQYC